MLEFVGILVFFALMAVIADDVVEAVDRPSDLPLVGLCAVLGYLLAEFFSGVVHWAGDTLGNERTPIFGPNFVKPFREHHVDQKAITRHDFLTTNGNNCLAATPLLLFIVFVLPAAPGVLFYGGVVVAFAAFFVFCTNQLHKWAHADTRPAAVSWLQRAHLILSPEHHQIHHTAPHDTHYCITVGWLNPLLARLRFFRACEWVVARIAPGFLYLDERRAFVAAAAARPAPDERRASA